MKYGMSLIRSAILVLILSSSLLFTSACDDKSVAEIIFYSNRDGNHEIYRIDADGSNLTRLTNDPRNDVEAYWSPDGSKIAFYSLIYFYGGGGEIHVMDADGSNRINLTNNQYDDTDPQWSPDGRKIAFLSERDGTREIYVVNADGSNQTNLTNNSLVESCPPRWSPDGSKIAFETIYWPDNDSESDIYVMNADGSNQTNLTG